MQHIYVRLVGIILFSFLLLVFLLRLNETGGGAFAFLSVVSAAGIVVNLFWLFHFYVEVKGAPEQDQVQSPEDADWD